jgi:3'-phosphoadenosine 5'-phosphosulfate sulfotransferase (PAPS reductase)/FAD synthetase
MLRLGSEDVSSADMNLCAAPPPRTLVQLGLPGRLDRGVEVDDEISALLAADAPCAIGVSGGKDSCAAAIATVEHLDAIGHKGPRILIHADLGDPDPSLDVEWSDSLPTCERLATHLGIELMIVRRSAGGMMKRWQKRWQNNVHRYANLDCVKLILPWSTPKMRFCTSELKSAPMASALVKRFPGRTIVSACGVRRAESSERASALTSKLNKRLCNKSKKTNGVDWNPIAAWSETDVFAFCASRGFTMHEGYERFGMSRISCRFCIMAKRTDLAASATCAANAPVYRTMVSLEIASTFAFQGSNWLGDVAPHLLSAEQRAEARSASPSCQPPALRGNTYRPSPWPHEPAGRRRYVASGLDQKSTRSAPGRR